VTEQEAIDCMNKNQCAESVGCEFCMAERVGVAALETLAKVRAWYERTTTSDHDALLDAMNELGNTILKVTP
jgi:hypothetical protein